jgi:hypothetical protein
VTVEAEPGPLPVGSQRLRADSVFVVGLFVALLVFTIGLVVLSVPAGIYAVFSDRLSSVYDFNTLARPYLWIGPVVWVTQLSVSLGAWFLTFTGVYVLFLAYAFWQAVRPPRAIASSFREGFSSITSSPFLVTIIAIGFTTFAAYIIDSVVSSSGVAIGGPSGDPLTIFMGFTAAPLVEEFGFRVVLIGIVALVLSVGLPWKDALKSLWRPSRVTEGLAVGSGASMIIWAATGFSALTFGACHVVCGNTSWDIGKLPEAAFGGLVLGVLYVKYGFHVAVLTHWGVDFVGSAFGFFGQAVYGIPWAASPPQEYIGQYLVDIDMVRLFGVASFLLVIYLAVRRLVIGRSAASLGGFKEEMDGGTPSK